MEETPKLHPAEKIRLVGPNHDCWARVTSGHSNECRLPPIIREPAWAQNRRLLLVLPGDYSVGFADRPGVIASAFKGFIGDLRPKFLKLPSVSLMCVPGQHKCRA